MSSSEHLGWIIDTDHVDMQGPPHPTSSSNNIIIRSLLIIHMISLDSIRQFLGQIYIYIHIYCIYICIHIYIYMCVCVCFYNCLFVHAYIILYYVMLLCYIILYYIMLYYIMLYYIILYYMCLYYMYKLYYIYTSWRCYLTQGNVSSCCATGCMKRRWSCCTLPRPVGRDLFSSRSRLWMGHGASYPLVI